MPGCQRKSTEKNTEKQPDDAGQPGRKEISMKAIRLQTEYLTKPLGLGIARPRFSWNCEGGIR